MHDDGDYVACEIFVFLHHSSKIPCDNTLPANLLTRWKRVIKLLIHDFADTHVMAVVFPHHLLIVCSAYDLLINRKNGLVGRCCCMQVLFHPLCAYC